MLFETIIWPTPDDAVGPDDQAPAEAGPERRFAAAAIEASIPAPQPRSNTRSPVVISALSTGAAGPAKQSTMPSGIGANISAG